jgi:tetratricopeptide (TPR) repeat protein
LKASAGAPPAKHVPNGEAHDWVLKARYDLQQLTTEALMRVEAEYQHAIDLDPQYAAAYLGLGTAKYDQFAARGSVFQTEAERRTAEQLIHRALELDPDLPAGHSMLALLAMQYDWNWGGAERELQTAAAGAPDATVESTYTLFLIYRGRFAEADQHIRRMADLDPFSTTTMNNVGLAKYLEGRFAEAREVAQRMAAQAPKMISPPQMIGMTYVAEGHPELALPIFRQLKQRFPPGQIFEALAYAAGGQRNEALRLIRPYEEKYPNAGVPMQWFAMVYANMGDEPNTVKWLQRSADRHEFQVLNIAIHPAYERFRSSPEFRALEKRVGLEQ